MVIFFTAVGMLSGNRGGANVNVPARKVNCLNRRINLKSLVAFFKLSSMYYFAVCKTATRSIGRMKILSDLGGPMLSSIDVVSCLRAEF